MTDDYAYIRSRLAELAAWCEQAAGPLIAHKAQQTISDVLDAVNDLERTNQITTDLLIEATRGDT